MKQKQKKNNIKNQCVKELRLINKIDRPLDKLIKGK